MMRLVGYVVLGVLAYAGFLIASFPAERAFALLNMEAMNVRAAGLSGTAWSGKAVLLQVEGRNLERVSWQVKPWSVLLGQLNIDVELDGTELAGSANVGLHADGLIQLSAVDLQVSAAEVSALLNTPVDLGGRFDVQLQSAELMGQLIRSAEGNIRWQRAGVVSPIAQPLGEFVAELTTEEAGVKGLVKDEGGPLQLDGIVMLSPDGAYDFNGSVGVRDRQQTMLVQGVQAMGRPGKDGQVPLQYSGRLQ